MFSDIFTIPFDDGIEYDLSTISTREITKLDKYQGINICITALLGNIHIPVSIDIGFGDVIVPSKIEMTFPVLLDMESPKIYCYSIESTLAEKFEAIVSLGYANSRYKDFYDLYVILQNKNIDKAILKEALIQTFKNRKTSFTDIVIFEPDFAFDSERQKRWNSFVNKKKAMTKVDFIDVVDYLNKYFKPIISEIIDCII